MGLGENREIVPSSTLMVSFHHCCSSDRFNPIFDGGRLVSFKIFGRCNSYSEEYTKVNEIVVPDARDFSNHFTFQ